MPSVADRLSSLPDGRGVYRCRSCTYTYAALVPPRQCPQCGEVFAKVVDREVKK